MPLGNRVIAFPGLHKCKSVGLHMTCSLPMIGATGKDPVNAVANPVGRDEDLLIYLPQAVNTPLHLIVKIILFEIVPVLAIRPGPKHFWNAYIFPGIDGITPPGLL